MRIDRLLSAAKSIAPGGTTSSIAAIAAAISIFVIARAMPQRTMEGARMYAQLAAYRRTLQRTLEQSRTMDQVVSSKALPWVETPDQAMVWAYALGLHEEAEEVLERFDEALAWMDCELRHQLDLGSHTLFIGEVIDVGGFHEGLPLTTLEYNGVYLGKT